MKRNTALGVLLTIGLVQPLHAEAQTAMQTQTTGQIVEGSRGRGVRGQVVARQFTTLSTEIAGKIVSISVKDGDRFSSGNALIELDCAVQQAQLDEAVAALRAASATRQVNQRLRQLNSAADLEIELALAEEAKAQARVNATRAILSKCKIDAPFSGKVAELKVQPLQYVQPGQPVLEVIDDGGFEVEFLAPSSWLKWLKRDLAFNIEIDETRRSYAALVARIGGRVDAISETVKVYGIILQPDPDLVPGMSGSVTFK